MLSWYIEILHSTDQTPQLVQVEPKVTDLRLVTYIIIINYLAMEIVGPSQRTRAIAFRTFFWPLGTMFTSLLAYYFQDWNWLQLAISVGPYALGILFNWKVRKEGLVEIVYDLVRLLNKTHH